MLVYLLGKWVAGGAEVLHSGNSSDLISGGAYGQRRTVGETEGILHREGFHVKAIFSPMTFILVLSPATNRINAA